MKENIKPCCKVLDIGCAFGRHIEIIAGFSTEVVGIDNNADMIKKAKLRLSNFQNVKLFLQDAHKLSFEDNYFDYVICMGNTWGNFPDIKIDVLKEMKRVCKTGGKIILSVYNDKALEFRIIGYKKVGLHITKIQEGMVYTKEGLISEQFTKKQLKEIFDVLNLKSKIVELNLISFACELKK